jgi:serine protease Do
MNIKMFFSLTSLFILILTSIPSHAQKVNRVEDVVEKTNKVSQNLTSRYAKLEILLKAQDFRAADLETDKVMLAVAKRENEGWLRIEDVKNFPCKELRSIDQLWLKYSRGKFGISVQQQIYQSLGGTKKFNYRIWKSMGDRVGWRQGGQVACLQRFKLFTNSTVRSPAVYAKEGSRGRNLRILPSCPDMQSVTHKNFQRS